MPTTPDLIALAASLAIVAGVVIEINARMRQVVAQNTRLERQLDRIAQQLGIDLSTAADAEVLALVREGNKIAAIKRYREIHHVGLREAKDAVDAM